MTLNHRQEVVLFSGPISHHVVARANQSRGCVVLHEDTMRLIKSLPRVDWNVLSEFQVRSNRAGSKQKHPIAPIVLLVCGVAGDILE